MKINVKKLMQEVKLVRDEWVNQYVGADPDNPEKLKSYIRSQLTSALNHLVDEAIGIERDWNNKVKIKERCFSGFGLDTKIKNIASEAASDILSKFKFNYSDKLISEMYMPELQKSFISALHDKLNFLVREKGHALANELIKDLLINNGEVESALDEDKPAITEDKPVYITFRHS